MKPLYSLERWPHGWLFCGAPGSHGIPMDALSECQALFPKDAVMDMGIPHHFHGSGRREVVCCVVDPASGAKWRAIITESLAGLPPEERWWRGLDVGTSSAALFATFAGGRFRFDAGEMGRGSVPVDAGDFGRCSRLLEMFPEWLGQLHRVAEKYPDTKWPALVRRWTEIANLPASETTKALRTL